MLIAGGCYRCRLRISARLCVRVAVELPVVVVVLDLSGSVDRRTENCGRPGESSNAGLKGSKSQNVVSARLMAALSALRRLVASCDARLAVCVEQALLYEVRDGRSQRGARRETRLIL